MKLLMILSILTTFFGAVAILTMDSWDRDMKFWEYILVFSFLGGLFSSIYILV